MTSTHTHNKQSAISRLSGELLLSIFEKNLTPAALAACALSCKRWNTLVTNALYKHVVLLNSQHFATWGIASPPSSDAMIETLTIGPKTASGNADSFHSETMPQFCGGLVSLGARIGRMSKLKSLSITSPKNPGHGAHIPGHLVIEILDHIRSPHFRSLELVIRHGPCQVSSQGVHIESHLCPVIRQLLPRLRYIRLALPSICPECFGHILSDSANIESKPAFAPAELSNLKECIIILATPRLGNKAERFDGACTAQSYFAGMTAIVNRLVALVNSGNAPAIKKFWVYDSLAAPDDEGYSYGAFVRRDVLDNKSYTFPYHPVAPLKRADSFFIRMPADEGGADIMTIRDCASCVVENRAWKTAVSGTRLPSALMASFGLCEEDFPQHSRAQWAAISPISFALWKNEDTTGMRLLDGELGGLLQNCPSVIRIPDGWQRGFMGFLDRAD